MSTRYKLMYSSVPSSNKFASFLFEKQFALIYQVVASLSFLSYEQKAVPKD